MKTVLQDYGKVIIVIASAIGILLFLIMQGPNSFAGMMKEPEATYKTMSAEALVDEIATRPKPVLEVKSKKLQVGATYNLLDPVEYQIISKNADDDPLTVTLTKIIFVNASGEREIDPSEGNSLSPLERGYYYVSYHTEENYHGTILENDVTKIFVVD